jgi:hypothetical protein
MKARVKRIGVAVFCAFIYMSLVLQEAIACPNCKEGFEKGTEQASVGVAYSLTIGLLLIVPMLIVATIIVKIKKQWSNNSLVHRT